MYKIQKYKNICNDEKVLVKHYVNSISKEQNWNTLLLLEYTEMLDNRKTGTRLIYQDEDLIGFFIISDKDGDNTNSDNFKKFQQEEKALWFCSFYIDKKYRSPRLIYFILERLFSILVLKSIYVYIENSKLKRIISKRFETINEENSIYKISVDKPIKV